MDEDARHHHTDLLFSAAVGERRAWLYVLFEHQSAPDRWMPLRMLIYVVRIWSRVREGGAERLPAVVPVVLHHGEHGWSAPRRLSELMDVDEALMQAVRGLVPDFELLIDDLVRVPESELVARPMTALARLTVWALRAVRVGFEPELLPRWAAALEDARRAAGPEALEVFLVYLLGVQEGDSLYRAILSEDVSESVREVSMGLRKQWEDEARQEGLERGREQGLERGREQGRQTLASVLLAQLQLKFGPPPAAVQRRLSEASTDELARWAEAILLATSLDDVFRG